MLLSVFTQYFKNPLKNVCLYAWNVFRQGDRFRRTIVSCKDNPADKLNLIYVDNRISLKDFLNKLQTVVKIPDWNKFQRLDETKPLNQLFLDDWFFEQFLKQIMKRLRFFG